MTFTPRPYQQEAIDRSVRFLRSTKGKNGLVILPTGSGKSICIAGIVKALGEPTLVFQPSKEILAQNAAKYASYGYDCGIYSASAGQKKLRDVTFATVGSVVKKLHLLERFKYVIVDECFPAGTMIDGRPIQDIRPGDYVNSYNHWTERIEVRKVVRTFARKRKNDLVKVTLVNGASFVCTYNHPVHTREDAYVPAGFLTNETVLFNQGTTDAEYVALASVERYEPGSGAQHGEVREGDTVYNFEVDINHNYFANGVLVHNCHGVNAKGGMYETVLSHMAVPTIGLTATPYRLGQESDPWNPFDTYSVLKFLTRTRPRMFDEVVYYVQNRELFDAGYLARIKYYEVEAVNRKLLRKNSTGADWTDASVKAAYQIGGFDAKVVKVVRRLLEIGRKNVLVFTRFVEEAAAVARAIPGAELVSADTPPKERDRIIGGFRSGRIPVVCNVGILTTGFDYPELEAVVMARPTMSLALWYQVVGRGIRPHPGKDHTVVVDMAGNFRIFGKVEDLELSQAGGWHVTSGGRQLTNVRMDKIQPVAQHEQQSA